jgi:hypothetical protein
MSRLAKDEIDCKKRLTAFAASVICTHRRGTKPAGPGLTEAAGTQSKPEPKMTALIAVACIPAALALSVPVRSIAARFNLI